MLFISQNSGHSELGSSATQGRAGVHRAPREPARYNFCGQWWTLKLEPHHAPVDVSPLQSQDWLWEKPSLLLSRARVIQLLYQTHKPTEFPNMQVNKHNTQWVKTHCSLPELRKPALMRVGPSWYRTGPHSRACLLPSSFLVPNLLPHSHVLSLAHGPSSQTGAAPRSGPMAGQREAWLQGAEGHQAGRWHRDLLSLELHTGRARGKEGQLPCSGDGTKQCQQSLKDYLALFLQSTGILVLVTPGKLARGYW